MKIIIPTCDKYRNVLEANKFTLDKFGGSEVDVTVLGYKEPEFDMGLWKFVSLGEDTGAQSFTNDINNFFHDFTDEYFIYGNDDCVLVDKFNIDFLQEIIKVVKEIPNFGRMWLTQTPASYYGGADVVVNFGNYQISEIHQGANYRLSLQYSLWKTSYFKKYLTANINPWEWETRNAGKYDGAMILLPVNNYVVNLGHVMKRGTLIPNWYQSIYGDAVLNQEDINNITEIFKKHKLI